MRPHGTRNSHGDTAGSDLCSRDILVMEEERHRLARELHDGPMQTLVTMGVRLELCSKFSRANDLASLRDELADIRRDFHASMSNLRNLMTDWRLPPLEEDNLREAIVGHVREYENLTGIEVSLDLDDLPRVHLDKERKVVVYRILQEALRNASRHSEASQVAIKATLNTVSLQVSISDNGKGFNLLAVTANYPRRGLGLAGMQERAQALGGRLMVDSQPGLGTTILLTVPLPDAKPDVTSAMPRATRRTRREPASALASHEEPVKPAPSGVAHD